MHLIKLLYLFSAIGRPWDNSQSQTPSDSFGQSSNPAYQDSYNQPPVSQASQDYQKNYPQTKSDVSLPHN